MRSNNKKRRSWKGGYQALLKDWNFHNSERRTIIKFMAVIPALILLSPILSWAKIKKTSSKKAPPSKSKSKLQEPWLTLEAVQEHLLPSMQTDDTVVPGAIKINSLLYLKENVLDDPSIDKEEKIFILNGVQWLNGITKKNHSKSFNQLSYDQREKALRTISNTRAGERWISTILEYLFEAMLSDPVYGGNPNQIGWKGLKHRPGFPRPPKNKRYQDLMKL